MPERLARWWQKLRGYLCWWLGHKDKYRGIRRTCQHCGRQDEETHAGWRRVKEKA